MRLHGMVKTGMIMEILKDRQVDLVDLVDQEVLVDQAVLVELLEQAKLADLVVLVDPT